MDYINKFITAIVNPLIILMFALALVYFLYGVFLFVKNADAEGDRETGKTHILWGLVGLFVMVSVYGILKIVVGTVGATPPAILNNKI